MIIGIFGNIGSGKTVSAVKEIVDRYNKFSQFPVTNFELKNINYYRIKKEDIILKEDGKFKVNWEFWDKFRSEHKNFSIYLDELHNIAHARTAMKKENIIITQWLSQIRKIFEDKKQNHIYIISQSLYKIDVIFREMIQAAIFCNKITARTNINNVYIKQKIIFIDDFIGKTVSKMFLANPYFKYYDTNKIVFDSIYL